MSIIRRASSLGTSPGGLWPACSEPTNPSPPPLSPLAADQLKDVPDDALPFVYTQWKHFTVADGLPNDHIFAVKADGPRVWIGTEDGLACYDKRTGKIPSWKEKDGLPWQVVTAIDVDKKTGDVWLGLFGGGLARFSGGRFDHFNQLNSGLVNDVVYGVAVEDDNIWAATTAGCSRYNTSHRRVGDLQREERAHGGDLELLRRVDQGKVYLGVWGSGCLEYDLEDERTGRIISIPTARWRSTSTATTGSST